MSEEIKAIPSCPLYQISDKGDVYNSKGKKLSSYINMGYSFIALKNKDGVRKNYSIHRLVYEAWGGELDPKLWINHKDGVKSNNHISNLELVTPSYNHIHAYKVLGKKTNDAIRFNNGALSKLKWEAIIFLRKYGWSQRKIADVFEISQAAISQYLSNLQKER